MAHLFRALPFHRERRGGGERKLRDQGDSPWKNSLVLPVLKEMVSWDSSRSEGCLTGGFAETQGCETRELKESTCLGTCLSLKPGKGRTY